MEGQLLGLFQPELFHARRKASGRQNFTSVTQNRVPQAKKAPLSRAGPLMFSDELNEP
jgi:hypothetical protein